jgi:hypothetical protein
MFLMNAAKPNSNNNDAVVWKYDATPILYYGEVGSRRCDGDRSNLVTNIHYVRLCCRWHCQAFLFLVEPQKTDGDAPRNATGKEARAVS